MSASLRPTVEDVHVRDRRRRRWYEHVGETIGTCGQGSGTVPVAADTDGRASCRRARKNSRLRPVACRTINDVVEALHDDLVDAWVCRIRRRNHLVDYRRVWRDEIDALVCDRGSRD